MYRCSYLFVWCGVGLFLSSFLLDSYISRPSSHKSIMIHQFDDDCLYMYIDISIDVYMCIHMKGLAVEGWVYLKVERVGIPMRES